MISSKSTTLHMQPPPSHPRCVICCPARAAANTSSPKPSHHLQTAHSCAAVAAAAAPSAWSHVAGRYHSTKDSNAAILALCFRRLKKSHSAVAPALTLTLLHTKESTFHDASAAALGLLDTSVSWQTTSGHTVARAASLTTCATRAAPHSVQVDTLRTGSTGSSRLSAMTQVYTAPAAPTLAESAVGGFC